MSVPSILEKILATKREEVAEASARRPLEEVERVAARADAVRDLVAALRRPPGAPVRVLAEIKRASPSAGPIWPDAVPTQVAWAYADGGAAAISVLTDRRYFDGDLGFIDEVRAAVLLPVLRKDFIIDRYQVVEARAAGADAVLLIAAALDDATLRALAAEAARLGMAALVEVHDEREADRAVAAGATLIGVNHRDLASFAIDMGLTERLAARLAGAVLVAESGIKTPADVARLGDAGAHAVLVGETLMRDRQPERALRALRARAP
jgi:indole-3-glycerol phosphate synthase